MYFKPVMSNVLHMSPLFLSQGFYVALRLVACAQSGQEISLSSLNLTVPPPKFVSTTSFKLKSFFLLKQAFSERYFSKYCHLCGINIKVSKN